MAFEWMDCQFFLRRRHKQSEVTLNLTSSHRLEVHDKDKAVTEVQFDVATQFSRPFMHSAEHGWNWHKCWAIPDISVDLKTNPKYALDFARSQLKLYVPPEFIEVELVAVKPVLSREYSLCVEDVGLEGNSLQKLSSSGCVFTGLKFSGTSFNSQGSGFHLLLLIYSKGEQEDSQRILLSRISSPIFVDSRKSVREAELSKLRKLNSYLEPFEPSQIQKEFTKKDSRKNGASRQERITNDADGFIKYLSAANIRYKVRHPLFMAIRFSRCFTVYYNMGALQLNSDLEDEQAIHLLQESLNQILVDFAVPKQGNTDIDDKFILLHVNLPANKRQKYVQAWLRKVADNMEVFQHDTIRFVYEESDIPSTFKALPIGQHLFECYENTYQSMLSRFSDLARRKSEHLQQAISEGNSAKRTPATEDGLFERSDPFPVRLMDLIKEQAVYSKPDEQNSCEPSQPSQPADSFESSSDNSTRNYRPDIPLKCEILINPIRKRPMKLARFLELDIHNKPELPLVQCQKSAFCLSDIATLNKVLREQIAQKKEYLMGRRKQQSASQRVESDISLMMAATK